MIIFRLMGGVGNQLFEYAVARAVALQNDTDFKLDVTSGFAYDAVYKRKYALANFNVIENFASTTESYMDNFGKLHRVYDRLISKYFPHYSTNYVLDGNKNFNPDILRLKNKNTTTYFDGYWQSPKYFFDVWNVMRNDFKFKHPIDSGNLPLSEKIRNTDSVSIHVRKLYCPNGAHKVEVVGSHGLCNLEYYKKAVCEMTKKVLNPHFYVFSDSPEWAEQNIIFDYPATYVKSGQISQGDIEDLHLMSLCSHHIIANSTFSWWGAWLSSNPNKIIIAPRDGFNNSDAIPLNWICV